MNLEVSVSERVVAIDGPAGAGKSTVARLVAQRLDLGYLDTGAMYRAVTYAALTRGLDLRASDRLAELARNCSIVIEDDAVSVDGRDATAAIRGREVTDAVSTVAADPMVRAELVTRQREWLRRNGGGVVEGRDIGTVVVPDAKLKLYVTASPRVRAERRVAQTGGDVAEVEASIIARDRRDSNRLDSPLAQADDAIVIDTSDLGVDEVVDRVAALYAERVHG